MDTTWRTFVTAGLLGLAPIRAFAQSGPDTRPERAIIVLHDVSGSLRNRGAGWYEAFRIAVLGVVSGGDGWRENWTLVGSSTGLLDSIAVPLPTAVGVSRFGTAANQPPYFSIYVRPAEDRRARAAFVEQTFPSGSAYREGKTYVDLAKAYAASHLADLGYGVVYLIVLSDFQNDADYNSDQVSLINRYETQSLALKHGTPLILEYGGDAPIKIEVVRLAREPSPGEVPVPCSVRLLRPGSTAQAGSVLFTWQPCAGAATYELAVRPVTSGIRTPPPLTVSGTSREIPRLQAGTYRWSVTAKNTSQQTMGRAERSVKVQGGGGPGTVLVLALVAGGLTAGVVWYIRRRRATSAAA